MKLITTIALMWITAMSAQIPTNDPELINPVVQEWIRGAMEHGVDTTRLKTLESITILDRLDDNGFAGGDYWNGKIRLSREKFYKDDGERMMALDIKWKVFHEIAHHYGVNDCYVCRYNIFAGNSSTRALYLYRDDIIERLINRQYWDHLKDPTKPHNHF